ncbi:Rne/Rng family ribonuclease [Streptomyces acidiscabies]|uniref:Rne/Rng family ribonuclease n=1 Tax=Streptomyces acidiscabies TaxID=42234 RepID=UPI00073F03D2|nr:Rne/Rng family ribonuclease [Streptomyces acidiscabies]GAQ54984.1 ribonuclease E [Streptomyces acidiscabies]GAV42047.1 ribonuclease E [Streptomyces acidiscabies]
MLEPTDPIEGSEQNTPSDTLPPRRRRRAASRPAGPPAGAEGGAENTSAIQADEAAQTATTPAEATPAPSVAAEERAADAPVETAPRARRRVTRRASAPAGAPQAAEEAVVVAAPAVEEAPAVEDEAPAPRTTRRRASRRASAPAGAPKAAEAEAVVETPVEAPVAVEAPAAVEAPVVEEAVAEETGSRRRRRVTRQVTAPAEESEAVAEAPAQDEAPATKTRATRAKAPAKTPSPVAEAPEEGGPRRSRRRVVSKAAGGFSEPAPAADESPKRAGRPAVAVFQAPVFTEPKFQFQTLQRAAAEAAAAEAEAPAEVDAEVEEEIEATEPISLPEAVAEEPAGSRRRRRRRGAAAPAEDVVETVVEPEPVVEEEPEDVEDAVDAEDSADDDAEESGSRRRRRRGGRRRRRGESAEDEADAEELAAEQAEQDAEDSAEQDEEDAEDGAAGSTAGSRRRRRRRRRAGDSGGEAEQSDGDPERTVVKVREPRKQAEPSDEVQSIKGSTRLEAKKQRRREGREQGRRRVPIITEAEFLARREAVERVMVVRQSHERTQIGVLEDGVLVEHYVNKEQSTSYVGNVYLGKVQNVLPSMEAAFIDIGKGRNAVLYAGEVNFEALGMSGGPRRIESALKSGQSVLVQVTKDPIGHKGARLTSQVSLPGRYLVYVPEGSMTGISRKLPDTERARLKTILKKIVPEDAGVIVRTAAEGASEDELRRDVERLQGQWEEIRKNAKTGNAPTLLYGEPDMTVRVVRDIFNEDFTKVVVSGDEAWQTIHGYVAHVAPDLAGRLSRWTSEVDVFATYRIDEQLAKALDRKVWLPSGGSLVIDRTEAMVVVDVNTGKFTGQGGNLEETVTRNNLEAAEEIVRQLRLRDLGGIIVIDFIDMVLESNRDLVLRRLLECLGRDRTKHQVAEVTSLGLVQMTRKRVGQGLLESFSETCVHCNGRGVIVHLDQPSAVGGGGKRKKRGRGGDEHGAHEHVVEDLTPVAVEESVEEVAAEVAAPVSLPAPEFEPDEELYSSVAEAEAAATRGRGRRRASRRVSSPGGASARRDVVASAAEVAADPVAIEDPVAEVPVVEAPVVVEEPVVEAPVVEAVAEPVVEGRPRRRATRKASAPAGSPSGAEAGVVTVVEAAAPVAEAVVEAPVVEETVAAAPARARRRAVREVAAPTSSDEAAVVVVPAVVEEEAPAPAKKTAARKTATKKATAKKAAPAKKTAAKKTTTAAKKTAAKKTTAKKTTKAAAKKTAAAEQASSPSVSAAADES